MPLTRARYRIYGGPANYLRALRDLLLGRHRTDVEVPAAEAELARAFGSPHAVLTSLARVGIHDLVRRFVPPGRGLLLSPYTIVDVVNLVVAAGARPIFVDVEPATGNLCPAALARAVAGNPDAAAVLVTHLHGVTADLDGIGAVARAAGLPAPTLSVLRVERGGSGAWAAGSRPAERGPTGRQRVPSGSRGGTMSAPQAVWSGPGQSSTCVRSAHACHVAAIVSTNSGRSAARSCCSTRSVSMS